MKIANWQLYSSIPAEKKELIMADVKLYLAGSMRLKDICTKHTITPWIAQKIVEEVIKIKEVLKGDAYNGWNEENEE